MKLTKLIYSKEDNRQGNLQSDAPASEAAQILHLKRLLVTLKQHYEKTLHTLQVQLQAEQNQRLATQKNFEDVQIQLKDCHKLHEEELQALRNQQGVLKDLLKKSQDELKQFRDQPIEPESDANRQRVEQLERVIPYLRDRTEEANLETEQIREELESAQKKVKILEQELSENKQNAQREVEHLQQLLANQQEDQIETVVSPTSSHHLRRELEEIKRHLSQGNQEAKALEARYVEVLNEKIGLEHQCKQLQLQLEHQSSNLSSFQTQLHEMGDLKKSLELSLKAKENEWVECCQQIQSLQKQIQDMDERVREKDYIQDKYEQMKDEWKQLNEHLEDAVERRAQAEQHFAQLETDRANQEKQLHDISQQLELIQQEKQALENERDQLKILVEEGETRLKVAQQHLAKKVKEAALLTEKVEEQQADLSDYLQNCEHQKMQLAQMQASVELYQRQEKRLQEQLHDALKGTEGQIAKWEEKYFRMYDKWQESENKIRELKKFEEKHHQMQNLIANLGNFMGGSFSNSNQPFFHPGQEQAEKQARPISTDHSLNPALTEHSEGEVPISKLEKSEFQEEKYNIFGMRQSQEKFQPHTFS